MKDLHQFLSDKKFNPYTILIILLLSATLMIHAEHNMEKHVAENVEVSVGFDCVSHIEIYDTGRAVIKYTDYSNEYFIADFILETDSITLDSDKVFRCKKGKLTMQNIRQWKE